jgi:hypothetical protein
MTLIEVAALAASAGGIMAGIGALAVTRRLGLALSVALELLTAAGLLRLSAEGTWKAVASAATVIIIRKLVGSTIKRQPASA